jgi:hypothetical protein
MRDFLVASAPDECRNDEHDTWKQLCAFCLVAGKCRNGPQGFRAQLSTPLKVGLDTIQRLYCSVAMAGAESLCNAVLEWSSHSSRCSQVLGTKPSARQVL